MADKPTENLPQATRPHFTRGYGIDRSKTGGLLSWDWVKERMQASRNYWVSTTNQDGSPHAAPVWGVWRQGVLYFGTNRISRKGRNLAADPRVVVHLESGDDVVIFEGVLEELLNSELFEQMAGAYEAKYGGFRPQAGADPENIYYALRPVQVFAWREKDYLESATVWNFGQAEQPG